MHAIDASPGVLRALLFGLHRCHFADGAQAAVLGERHWNGIQCRRERAHAVLLECLLLVRSSLNREASRHLARTSAWNNSRVSDQIPHATIGIMQATFRFVDDHLVPSTDKDSD